MDFNNILLLAGVFLSALMSIAVGLMARKNRANIWFAGFLVSSALVFFVKYLYATGEIINQPHWFKVNLPFGLLRPLFFYLYGYFLLNSIQKFKAKYFLHFMPVLVLTAYLLQFFVQSADYKISVLNREITNNLGLVPSWYVVFQFIYSITYLLLLLWVFRKYISEHPRPNRTEKALINWIRLVGIGGGIFIALAILLRVFGIGGNYNIPLYELFSIFLILFCIRLLMLPQVIDVSPEQRIKYNKSGLSLNDVNNYLEQINLLMTDHDLYKKSDLKLADIAERIDVPDYLISKIINEGSGQSFRDYINSFRILDAKRNLLKSGNKYTIEGIANEAGFHSRASFYSAFKKHTNMTPSQYLQMER